MADQISASIVTEVLMRYGGPFAAIFVGVIVAIISAFAVVVRQWIRNAARKSDEDRKEHQAKWESLVKQHQSERERQFALFDRQADALELQAGILAKLTVLIETNQYCPVKRGDLR